mgnify:CR=1 FL=1
MAFTWEVEALRKLIEGIVEEVEIKQAGEELAQEHIDAYKKKPEASKLWDVYKEEWVANPDARVDPNDPFGLNDPDPVEGISYEEFYESLRGEEKHKQNMRYLRGLGKTKRGKDKLKLEWVDKILKEFPDKKRPDPTAGREWWQLPDETAVKKRGKAGSDKWYENWEKAGLPNWFDIPPDEYEYVPDEAYGEIVKDQQKKYEEDMPDLSPFLSYLLRQSPYARLPAAGLLGLGLMGYSKPAY